MNLSIQNMFNRVHYVKILVISFLAIVIGFGIIGILLPKIIRMITHMQLRLTPGKITRKIFEKIPFPLETRVYIFNITNKEEIIAGGMPILQELGPFYFGEYLDKFDMVDDDEEDTVEYDFRRTSQYNPKRNGPGLTGDEIVTVVHPVIVPPLLAVNVDRRDLLKIVETALNEVLHNPQDIFYTGRLWDLMYDGIILDCSSDSFETTAACSLFEDDDLKEIKRINETAFSFSLFGNTNATSTGRYKSLRGKKNIRDVGRVLEYNGITELDAWYEDECNQFSGTDGTIFYPFLEKEEGFTFFIPQMCRSLTTEYQHFSKFAGIKTRKFSMNYDVTRYGSPNCYCRDGESEGCPPEGIFDLFPCVGSPISISAPHFYKVDPAVREKFIGLNPDAEKHDVYIHFTKTGGIPIAGRIRFQISFEIVPIKEVSYMKDLQPMYLPLLWVETGLDIPKKYAYLVKYQLILALKLQILIKYGCAIGGFFGLILGAIACYFQIDSENNEVRMISANPDTNGLIINPQVLSIEVISNE